MNILETHQWYKMPYYHSVILSILESFIFDFHSYRNRGIKKEQRENGQLPCSSKKTFTRIIFKLQEQKAQLITVSTCVVCTFFRKCHCVGINQQNMNCGITIWRKFKKRCTFRNSSPIVYHIIIKTINIRYCELASFSNSSHAKH